MSMAILASLMFKILFMVMLGYLLSKTGIVDEKLRSGLSTLLVRGVVPIATLAAGNSAHDASVSSNLPKAMLIVLCFYAITFTGMVLLTRRFKIPPEKRSMMVMLVVFGNISFLGYPLMQEIFGNAGYLYAVIYNLGFQLLIATGAVRLMDAGSKMDIKGFLLNPLTISPIIAIAIFVSPWRFPPVLVEVLGQVGSMMTPLSMIIIGGLLATIPLRSIWQDKWSYLVSFIRLILLPLVMALVLKALGITGTLGGTMVLLTGISSGSLVVIFGEQYKQDVAFATRTLIQTMVLYLATLPLILVFTNWLFAL